MIKARLYTFWNVSQHAVSVITCGDAGCHLPVVTSRCEEAAILFACECCGTTFPARRR